MTKRIDQLTFTRFISAFGILVPHFSEGTIFEFKALKDFLLPFFGVSYFFILSGFVLGISYYGKMDQNLGNFDFKRYSVLRFARIYPVYILAFFLELFFLVKLGDMQIPEFKTILLNVLLLQGWFFDRIVNFPSWSLSCEMFFYAVFPFFLYKFKKMSNKKLLGLTALVWIVQQSVFYYLFYLDHADFGMRYNPLIHLPTFMTGIVIAIFFHRRRPVLTDHLSNSSNYLILFLIGVIIFNKSIFGYETTQTPYYLVFILLVSLPGNFFTKYLSGRFFINMGCISYSLYILQQPLGRYFWRLYSSFHLVDPDVRYMIFIPLVIILSAVCYFFYEKPLYKFLTNRFFVRGSAN